MGSRLPQYCQVAADTQSLGLHWYPRWWGLLVPARKCWGSWLLSRPLEEGDRNTSLMLPRHLHWHHGSRLVITKWWCKIWLSTRLPVTSPHWVPHHCWVRVAVQVAPLTCCGASLPLGRYDSPSLLLCLLWCHPQRGFGSFLFFYFYFGSFYFSPEEIEV